MAVAVASPLLAPLAASTVLTVAEVWLLPTWPVTITGPLLFCAEPLLPAEAAFDALTVTELLPACLAAPVATAGDPPLLTEVEAELMPLPVAGPLVPLAFACTVEPVCCLLVTSADPLPTVAVASVAPAVAVVRLKMVPLAAEAAGPFAVAVPCVEAPRASASAPTAVAAALPEFAPLAASTMPTVPVVVLPPSWPVAATEPLLLVAEPRSVRLLLLVAARAALELPPLIAAPVTTSGTVPD